MILQKNSPSLYGSWLGWPHGKFLLSLEGTRKAAEITYGRLDVRLQVMHLFVCIVAYLLVHLICVGSLGPQTLQLSLALPRQFL